MAFWSCVKNKPNVQNASEIVSKNVKYPQSIVKGLKLANSGQWPCQYKLMLSMQPNCAETYRTLFLIPREFPKFVKIYVRLKFGGNVKSL